jgi:RNA polymerase sigma factor FliA
MDKLNPEELWKQYKKNKDDKTKEILVKNYLPLVKFLTDRIVYKLPDYIRTNEAEDLYVEGIIGLLEAMDRFDPDIKVKFETFASKRIKGAILDTLRRADILPKNVREIAKKIELSMVKLENELGRPAEEAELIKELGMTNIEFYDILDRIKGISLISLNSEILNNDGEKLSFEDIIGEPATALVDFEAKEAAAQLALIIDKLNRDERIILEMYYWDELTLKEIGIALNISESRVCQIHTKLILQLRSGFRKLERER